MAADDPDGKSADALAGTRPLRAPAAPADPAALAPTLAGAPPASAMPPAVPSARYALGREIARGGMGRVVEAIDTTLGRAVALKEALVRDPDVLRRFEREVQITARLEHPGIVPVHDAGVGPDGVPYYVMRKVGGRPLEKLITAAPDLRDRLALLPNVLAATHAIAHAHARGVLHRDIKPSNILVGELGETIVIDWGLAKVIGDSDGAEAGAEAGAAGVLADARAAGAEAHHTRAGVVVGTPGFLAPEQLTGRPADRRADVYALGATLYHLLARRPPHHAPSVEAMLAAAAEAPPAPLREVVPGVPAELATIVDAALAHAPAARYPDAAALAADLQRFLTGQLVAAHRYSARERAGRWLRANRRTVGVAAVLLAALAATGVVAVTNVVRERDRARVAADAALAAQGQAEAARALAEDRRDQLALGQAATLARTDPTAALALLAPLAGTSAWREVVAIAAGAQAAGAPWVLPAPAAVRSLALSRDGARALLAGQDGVIRVLDLAARTTRTLARVDAPMAAAYADDERALALWAGDALAIVDVATGARRDLRVPAPIAALAVAGRALAWVDTAGALWQLDVGGTNPLEVPLDERVRGVAASPDGRWLALAGEQHLWLFDRRAPAAGAIEVLAGAPRDLAWSPDGAHLAALVDDSAIEIAVDDAPVVIQRVTVGARTRVATTGRRLFTVGPTGVAQVARDGDRGRRALTGAAVGLAEAPGGDVVAASERAVLVLGERGDRSLALPGAARLVAIAASPRAPHALGVVAGEGDDPGQLLIWDLATGAPVELAAGVAAAYPAGPGRVLATFADGPAQLLPVDPAPGAPRPGGAAPVTLGPWPSLLAVAAAPGGALAVIDPGHALHLVAPGGAVRAVPAAGAVDDAAFLDDARLAILDDRTLAVIDVGTGARARPITLPAAPTSNLLVAGAGRLVLATGRELRAGPPGAAPGVIATLPGPITRVAGRGPAHVVAVTAAGAVRVIALAPPHAARALDDVAPGAALAAEAGLIVEPRAGALRVTDPAITGRHRAWTLADAPNATYRDPVLTPDGGAVLARLGDRLLRWRLTRPRSQAEAAAWLRTLTAATSEVLQPAR